MLSTAECVQDCSPGPLFSRIWHWNMAGGRAPSSLSWGRRSRLWTRRSTCTWWPGYRHWLGLLNRCRSGDFKETLPSVFCFLPPSSFISMHCFQTGPQGSSISSGRRGVDQRKRSHEVMEITTFGNQEQFCKCIDRSWNSILTSSWWMCLYGRAQTKDIFNGQFGSLFRTYHNPTYFSRRLSRFADIYMASISCLLNYDLQHTFFPRRTPLQHESPFWPEHSPAGISVSSPFHRVDGN